MFAGRSPSRGQYEFGRDGCSFVSQRGYGPRLPFRGDRTPPARREKVQRGGSFGMRDRMDVANPTFEQMARHWFNSFCSNPSVESFAQSPSRFDLQAGGMENIWLIDSSCSRHMTGDRGWFSNLTPVVSKVYITFGDNGRGRVLSEGEIKVSDKVTLKRVALVKSLGYNLLSVSQLLDEGFEVRFKLGASRILDS